MQSTYPNATTRPVTNSAATISNLQASLMNAQIALEEATTELNELRLANASMKAEALARNRGPKKNKRIVVSTPVDYYPELLTIANKFTLLDFVWVKMSAFGNPCPPNAIPVEVRYSDDINTLLHIRYRLYECVPEIYHGYLQSLYEFGANYGRSAQQQRSNIISKLRTAAPIIFSDTYPEINSQLLSNPEDCGTSEVCCQLYMSGDISEPRNRKFEPLLAPIVYTEGNVAVEGIFQNEVLFLIGRCSLFGYTAIRGKIPKNSQGAKWGLKSVTSGLISFCCVAAIFLLSNDVYFEEVGGKSGINYGSAFLAYKQRLEVHENSPQFRKIIQTWNSQLFGDTALDAEAFDFAAVERNTRSAAIDAALSGHRSGSESPQSAFGAINSPAFTPDPPSSIASERSSLSANAPLSSVSRVHSDPHAATTLPISRTVGAASSSQPNSMIFTLPASNPGSVISFDQDDSSDDSTETSDRILASITQPESIHLPEATRPPTSNTLTPTSLLVTQPPLPSSSPTLPTIVVSPGPASVPEHTSTNNNLGLPTNEGSAVAVPKRGRPKKATQTKGQDRGGKRRSARNQQG